MSARHLIDRLNARGVELEAVGDRLRFRPKDRMTPELLTEVREHKTALLAALAGTAAADDPLPRPAASPVNAGDLPDEWREHFAERAAIMECDAPDAHPTREAAERAAWADTILQTGRWQDHEWITGDRLAALPADLQGLVMPREGWTPQSWGDYLRYKADRCEEHHPDLAGRYRRAADLLPEAPAEDGAGTGGKKSRYGA